MYTFLLLFFSHFYLLFLSNNGNKERLADKDFILLLFVTRFLKMISLVNFEDDFACAVVLYMMPFYQQKVTAACLDFPI